VNSLLQANCVLVDCRPSECFRGCESVSRGRESTLSWPQLTFSGTSSSLLRPLKHLKASIDPLTASTDTLMASIDILRDLFKPLTASKTSQGLYRHSHGLFLLTLSRPLLTLSQPLQHSQGLCSLQALNWLVIGNSQVLSHGCESVAEAKKVPVAVVREPVGKTVLKNSGTNQNVLVSFQNF
jgi:hypothetical protein